MKNNTSDTENISCFVLEQYQNIPDSLILIHNRQTGDLISLLSFWKVG
jgi:hypothetical protein